MNIRMNVRQSQVQSIAITAQIIQSIKLLQFSHEELETFLADQAERNPLLELEYSRGNALPQKTLAGDKDPTPEPKQKQADADRQLPRTTGSDRANTPDGGRFSGSGDISALDYYPVRRSLGEHLHAQAAMAFRAPGDRMLASQVIESIDGDGYFRRELFEIADLMDVSEMRVESILLEVQRFEPTGVGARDLAECLRLQLAECGRLDAPMSILLENLPLLAEYNIAKLSRLCKVDKNVVVSMAREIRALDPRPGRQYNDEPILPALPDILVKRQGDDFTIELNTDFLPKVLVNQEYFARITRSCTGSDVRKYVTDCMKSANWLVKNMDQRAKTLLRVATEIVAQQKDFLTRGAEYLRPLNLRDVAGAIGVHESTVSRAISNKYLLTDRGMFELKYFFTNSVPSAGGQESHSAETARHKIRQMIEAETIDGVLSDDAIVAALRSEDIQIARRTVAKYREAMNIPSSLQRRRYKLAQE